MHIRVCRDCGEEYRPEIARCADCGGELVDRHEAEDPAPIGATPPSDDAPPAADAAPAPQAKEEEVHPLYSGSLPDLEPMCEALKAGGVPYRIAPRTHGFIMGVAAGDLERALSILEPFRGRGTELGVAEYGYEVEEITGPQACPACGAPVTVLPGDCPDCGLAISAGEEP
jgi:hypothetical protein